MLAPIFNFVRELSNAVSNVLSITLSLTRAIFSVLTQNLGDILSKRTISFLSEKNILSTLVSSGHGADLGTPS